MKRITCAFLAAVFTVATLALPVAAQKEEWRNLVDPRPLDQLIAEYQAAKAQKIFTNFQPESKALAATFPWSVAIIGWTPGGQRVQAGSGEIAWNDELHGSSGLLTAGHVLHNPETGEAWVRMAVAVSPDLFTAVTNSDYVEIDMTKMVPHGSQDLAVIPIAEVLRDELGNKIEPVHFYEGVLAVNQPVCIGGYGRTGPTEIADTGIIPGSTFDGFRRAARLKVFNTSDYLPNRFRLSYNSLLPVAGQPGNGDSGGFAVIEAGGFGGTPQLCGILVQGTGVGVALNTAYEYIRSEQLAWIDSIRLANQIDSDGDGIPNIVELTP